MTNCNGYSPVARFDDLSSTMKINDFLTIMGVSEHEEKKMK